jgi:DNA-binding Xre family transcriptional regulator
MAQRPSRLALVRARKHLSQTELAEAAGVSRDVITAIETRRDRRIRVETWQRLAEALEVEIEDLLEEDVA